MHVLLPCSSAGGEDDVFDPKGDGDCIQEEKPHFLYPCVAFFLMLVFALEWKTYIEQFC